MINIALVIVSDSLMQFAAANARFWIPVLRLFGGWGNGDFYRFFFVTSFDLGSKGILEELSEDVFEMHGDVCKHVVRVAINVDRGSDAIFELANVTNEGFAVLDDICGLQTSVDDTNITCVGLVVAHRRKIIVRLGGKVQGNVLLSNQPRPDAGS